MKERGTDKPLTEKLLEFVDAQDETQVAVRIVFFNDDTFGRGAWDRLGSTEKREFKAHVTRFFKPTGNTRLFDTLALVEEECRSLARSFQQIHIYVFSDGDNNRGQIKSWAELDRSYGALKREQPESFVTLIALGEYHPTDRPPDYVVVKSAPTPSDIVIAIPPKAVFYVSPTSAKVGQQVSFAKIDSGGPWKTLQWTFGDGTGDAGKPLAMHAYGSPGTYTVALSATGPGGTAAATSSVVVSFEPPLVVGFRTVPDRKLIVGDTISLIETCSGDPTAFKWSVNGKPFSDQRSPDFCFNTPGRYEFSLEASRGTEAKQTALTLQAYLPPPNAQFLLSADHGDVGDKIQVTWSRADAAATSSWTVNGVSVSDAADSFAWIIPSAGVFEIVHVAETEGGVARYAAKVFGTDPGLAVARFSVDREKGRAPLMVSFTDKSEGRVASYAWDFGDGSRSDLRNPRHEYAREGIYTPRLEVTTVTGRKSVNAESIIINVIAPAKPLPAWVIPLLIFALLLALWIFVCVPLLTAKARKKAELMTLDLGGGDSRSLAGCLLGRFSSFKRIFLPVIEACLGMGSAGGSVDVPGATEACIAMLSPKGDGSCRIKASTQISVGTDTYEKGADLTQYPPVSTKIKATSGGELTLTIEDDTAPLI